MRNRVVIAYWTGAGLMAGEPVLSRAGSREWKRLWLEQVAAQGSGAEILPHLVACVAWPQGCGVPLIGAGALAAVAEGCQGWWRQQPETDEALTWLGQTFLKQILNQCGEEIPYLLWLQHPGGPPAYQLARLTALAGLAVAPGGLLAWDQAVLLLNPDLLLPAIQRDSCWYWIWDDSGLLGLRWQQLDGCWQVTAREFWPEFGGQQLEQEVSSRMGWHLARSHCWLQEPAAAGWWERKIKSCLELIRPRLQDEELLLIGDNWNRGGQLPALTDEQWLQNLMLAVFDRWQEQQTLPQLQLALPATAAEDSNWRQLYLQEKDRQQELLKETIETKKQMGRLQGLVEILTEENNQLRTQLQEMEKQLQQREKKLLRLERRIQQGGI